MKVVFFLATTIRDVAKRAGVSVATVSRVVNHLGGVKPDTEKKILKAMKELQYIPNLLARSVVSKRSHLISMIIPDIENPFFAAIYRGVSKISLDKSYMTLLGDSDDDEQLEEQLANHAGAPSFRNDPDSSIGASGVEETIEF